MPSVQAMFEPENLANASPATVSRAGIIYVSDSELGWGPPVQSWLAKREPAVAASLKTFFDKYVSHMLEFVRINLKSTMHNEQVCQVKTLITLLEGCLQRYGAAAASSPAMLERIFLYCLTWSLGSLIDAKDRPAFDAELRSKAGSAMPPKKESEIIYDYLVAEQDGGAWVHWDSSVPVWAYPSQEEKPKFAQLVIPTMDSVRLERLMQLVYSVNGASLLVGGPGTAKTCTINQFLSRFPPEAATSKTITFSSLTTPQIFQLSIEVRSPACRATSASDPPCLR